MLAPTSLQTGLDDLIADLRHARRSSELGRLALLAYCDARSWARQAGMTDVAEHSLAMFAEQPHANKQVFLAQIDSLIEELERIRPLFKRVSRSVPAAELPREATRGEACLPVGD